MIEQAERALPRRERPVAPSAAGRGGTLGWRTRAAIRVGGWMLRLLGMTWRVRVYGRQPLLERAADAPRVVLTLWHGQMLPLLWVHRQPTGVLISEHRDGDIIANIVGQYGFSSIRGSTSRGGARALLESVRVLRNGRDVVMTPDGPRGPFRSFAPGALVVAFRAQVAVVPLVVHTDRMWQLKSWDRFEIPRPFARITVVYGEPRHVEGDDVRAASEQVEGFAANMQRELQRAERLSRER